MRTTVFLSAVEFCLLTCSHGLILQPWAVIRPWLVILTIRYNSYSMLIDFDDRKLQLIFLQHINTNHVLVSVNRFNFNFLLSISLFPLTDAFSAKEHADIFAYILMI